MYVGVIWYDFLLFMNLNSLVKKSVFLIARVELDFLSLSIIVNGWQMEGKV